jgi:hypothetical protein
MGSQWTRRFLCWLLTLVLAIGAATSQTLQADKIRQQVDQRARKHHSFDDEWPQILWLVSRIGTDDFAINEVDQRREITLLYSEVRNVRADYGTTRHIRGQRIHPRTRLIVTLAVVGGLLALAFIAVAADKS